MLRFALLPPNPQRFMLIFCLHLQVLKKKIIEQAEVIEIFKGIDIPIAQIGHLLALKILSESPERPRDTQDIKISLPMPLQMTFCWQKIRVG